MVNVGQKGIRMSEQQKISTKGGEIRLVSKLSKDAITAEIEKCFDYKMTDTIEETITYPDFPKEFEIGVIVGSSGSGKTTIMREAFGEEERVEWDLTKGIASNFGSFEEASNKFGAVGLNSIPTWLKPYNVLSNGEKFRADLARRLHSYSVIDEFTSVVNREVAISCCCSIEKYIRRNGIHNIVFCSCHDDILPYLNPTWTYNTDTHILSRGYLQRPSFTIKLSPCHYTAWDMFKRYHYLSGEINPASVCYIATINETPCAFVALLCLPGRDVKHAWREHRVVVLPDYQGMGIGNRISETLAQAYIEKGCRYFSKTANPRMGDHRDKSPLWRATATNHSKRTSYFDTTGKVRERQNYGMKKELYAIHAMRVCYSHEYIGDGAKYPFTLTKDKIVNDGEQIRLIGV